MKYAVLTTKHHEGFCMWDTQYTDYKCTNTPAGRDLVREYVDAFRAEGLHIGFYYSLIDWHHPEFPIDLLHPAPRRSRRRRAEPAAATCASTPQYMRNQVDRAADQLRQDRHPVVRLLLFRDNRSAGQGLDEGQGQGRLGGRDSSSRWPAGCSPASSSTTAPRSNRTSGRPSSSSPPNGCATPRPANWSHGRPARPSPARWGYYRDEQTWKSPEMLIRMLVNTVVARRQPADERRPHLPRLLRPAARRTR